MKVRRIVTVIILVIVMLVPIVIDAGVSGVVAFWNAPSLILPLAVFICFLVVADSFSDFVRGFKIASSLGEHTMKELKASKNAYDLSVRLIGLSAVLMFLIGGINMLGVTDQVFETKGNLEAWSMVTSSVAVLSLTLLYGIIGLLIVYTIRAKIIKEIIYRKE